MSADTIGHGLSSVGWFSACGLPLEASDRTDARSYLDALGLPASVRIDPVASWAHAERILRHPGWDPLWWEREESERTRLTAVCIAKLGQAAMFERLQIGAGVEHDVIHGAAAVVAARSGLSDPALIRVAAGAASVASHCRMLAKLADVGPEHLFLRKFGLFEAGRWPLGIVDGVLHLF
ncbi:MAG: hypothetical protein MUF30_02540 [Burkholderiales bacterium]|nr:hypothetical protein [Burkholderiales bacterium]